MYGAVEMVGNWAPQIHLVGEVERQQEIAGRRRRGREERAIARHTLRTDVRRSRNGRKLGCTIEPDHGARLSKARFGNLQVLIPNGELLLQGIQLRVAKHFPPVATDGLVAGLGRLPPVTLLEGGRRRFFEGRRYWGRGCFVLWPHHTAAEQQRQRDRRVGKRV